MIESDREFLEAFDGCTLGRACWDHVSHLRMAWLKLEAHESFELALDDIRVGIRRYNASVASQGYHETVTVAFTRLIHYRRLVGEPTSDWKVFLSRNPDLLSSTPPILDTYYSRERLCSDEARREFVAPDKTPLPEL